MLYYLCIRCCIICVLDVVLNVYQMLYYLCIKCCIICVLNVVLFVYFQAKEGQWPETSRYCPLDLFSG